MEKSLITYRKTKSMIDAFNSLEVVRDLDQTYSDFSNWYINKVIPDIVAGDGSFFIAEDKNQIIGISIAKRGSENKLRCVRVLPEYQSKGVGIRLIEKTLRDINVDKPLASVSHNMIHDFSRIFVNYFSFSLTRVDKGKYQNGKLEYVFNGDLGSPSSY